MYTLQELADQVGGSVVGNPQLEINGIAPFESAEPGHLTLGAEKKYWEHLEETQASAVIVPPDCASTKKSVLQVEKPKVAFARLLALFHHRPIRPGGISQLARVGKHCSIAESATIHSFAFVGDDVVIKDGSTLFPGVYVGNHCVVGDHCVLHPNVTLYERVTLGSRVIIHSGAVVGADGFGYVFDGREQVKIPQTGCVIIGDDVEIGANSCVDRATFGSTVLERGVKLDNHVHIGHNCKIGENTVIVAQVGISGSVEIGRNCVFAGHSGTVDHVKIGDDVSVMMKTAVTKDVPSGSVISGQPAMDHTEWMKIEAISRRLPSIYHEWKKWWGEARKSSDKK